MINKIFYLIFPAVSMMTVLNIFYEKVLLFCYFYKISILDEIYN